ncbi:MAG: hypothetical protein B6U95_00195 [Thermofilum sp. ex4484_82]|nr:MAG: hypothetical protein B6U95_00195 [Thermofilum sp. ex4484_82]OYT40150.1 MAG: hypothetical protein B6U96_00195 [Archaeoglobales archaeon ex4484_92]
MKKPIGFYYDKRIEKTRPIMGKSMLRTTRVWFTSEKKDMYVVCPLCKKVYKVKTNEQGVPIDIDGRDPHFRGFGGGYRENVCYWMVPMTQDEVSATDTEIFSRYLDSEKRKELQKLLEEIEDNIDVIEDYLKDNELLEGRFGGEPTVTKIDEDGIEVEEVVKTGDGIDQPYDPDPRPIWKLMERAECVDTEGVMNYYGYLYCDGCNELFEADEVKPNKKGEYKCPKCGERMTTPTTPKFLYFQYKIFFSRKVKTAEELNEEFQKLFKIRISEILKQ